MSSDISHAASASRQIWAAMVLTPDPDVCRSILEGRPVQVRQLEQAALRRALRGAEPPAANEYLQVTIEMLAAVQEGGPFNMEKGRLVEPVAS